MSSPGILMDLLRVSWKIVTLFLIFVSSILLCFTKRGPIVILILLSVVIKATTCSENSKIGGRIDVAEEYVFI